MKGTTALTLTQAVDKARKYCAYQERCHSELRNKLYSWGLFTADVEQAMARMVEEGYLNEERFAKAFAGGKFRQQHWGRIRITLELKARDLSDYCIRTGLKEIDADDYEQVLRQEAEKKIKSLTGRDIRVKKYKVAQYLQGKGFEPGMIWDMLNAQYPESKKY